MSRTKKEQVKQRAVKVYRALIKGLSASDISRLEGIPLGQVYWHIHEGGRILDGEIKTLSKEHILRDLFHTHRERVKSLWLLSQTADQDTVKVSALRQLKEEDQHLLDLAQRLALIEIPKSTLPPVQVGVRIENYIPRPDGQGYEKADGRASLENIQTDGSAESGSR